MINDNSESNTPTGDAVEAWLKEQGKIPQHEVELNLSSEQRMAIEFSNREAELVRMMRENSDKIERWLYSQPPATRSTFFEKGLNSRLRLSVHQKDLQYLGTKFVTLDYSEKKYPKDFPETLDVDTLYRLDIGCHTDLRTREQVQGLEETDKKAFNILQSIYFFDEKGNFGKIVSLPKYIEDTREDLAEGSLQKYVIGEMLPGDFELVDMALANLKNRLESIISGNTES